MVSRAVDVWLSIWRAQSLRSFGILTVSQVFLDEFDRLEVFGDSNLPNIWVFLLRSLSCSKGSIDSDITSFYVLWPRYQSFLSFEMDTDLL